MGTNYYAVKNVDRYNLCNELMKIVYSENPLYVAEKLSDACEREIKVIHIGKSSCGWKFLFNHNNENYYSKTRLGIEMFLLECTIYDEYGDEITSEEFWKTVDSKKDGMDDKEYNEKHPEYRAFIGGALHDFYSDGLRFSTDTEFS